MTYFISLCEWLSEISQIVNINTTSLHFNKKICIENLLNCQWNVFDILMYASGHIGFGRRSLLHISLDSVNNT